ncbi:MAG: chromate transporter [Clostridia bacterium]|nr:chromate transporter [Clostridia bacterium]
MIKNKKFNETIKLFTAFFKIGLFTFGGGYAMLPMIQREITGKYKWATEEEVLDYYALGQSTPGIIAINTATFIGYKTAGIAGAIMATLGMTLPSLIIITALYSLISAYRENIYVQKALLGIRGAVIALILVSIVKMGKKAFKSLSSYFFGITGFLLLLVFGIPSYAIIIGAMAGAAIYAFFVKRRAF